MKLKKKEKQALKDLREAVSKKYPVIDFRLFGSRARGQGRPGSDLDVMIEIPSYEQGIVSDIDEMIYQINLNYDVFISALIFGKDELEEGPLSESPIYKVIQQEGIIL